MQTRSNKWKKAWKTPIAVIALFSLFGSLLSGCGGSDNPKTASGVVAKKDGETTIKTDEGSVKIKTDGKDEVTEYRATDGKGGEVVIEGANSKLPDDFPKDVAIPEGAEIVNSFKSSTAEAVGYVIAFNVKMSVKDTGDFYRKYIKEKGFTVSEFSDGKAVTLVGGNDKESLLVSIMTNEEDENATTVNLTYGTK